jgi:hypothetical protein
VIHIKGEYDYRVKSELRDQIIKLLKKLYFNLTKTVLPTYGVVRTLKSSHIII